MSTVVYVVQVVGDDATGYQAKFPDFPNLAVEKPTISALVAEARERLLAELKSLEASGADWPVPTPMKALQEREGGAAGLLLLVDAEVDDSPVRVNISIGERLLKRLDAAATAADMSRSGFIAAAVRQHLQQHGGSRSAGEASTSQQLYEEIAAIGRRVNEALGPESTIAKTLSDLDQRALDGLRALTSKMGKSRTKRDDRP